jgi:tetratricopeptide (TPR) repeat protein
MTAALWLGLTLFGLIAALGILAPIGDYLSERMLYFLLPGLLGLLLWLHSRVIAPRGELWSASAFVLAIMLAGAFGVRTSLREQDHQTWESSIRKQLAIHPESAQAHYDLGNQYLSRGQFTAARTSYERATELRPDLWMAWVNIGASYFAQEEYGLARRAYKKAIDGIGDQRAFITAAARAHYNRALVLMRQNENAEAARDLEMTLEVFPDHMAAHANLGLIYRNNPRHDEQALRHLGRAIELDHDPQRRKVLEESILFIEQRARDHEEEVRRRRDAGLLPGEEDRPDSTTSWQP